MAMLLARLFVKDYKNTDSPAVHSAYGKLAGRVGILCNALLCGGKFIAGVVSGSVSITADALNNLSDASSGIISLLGFKLAEKSADEEHPYGHARYEYLAGLFVALLVLVIGVELLRGSIEKIIRPKPVEFTVLSAAILAVSIPVKLWLMLFYRKIAKLIGSEALRASAADSRNDVISTASVLAAAVISHFTSVELDGIMGAAVAVFILYSGAGLVRDAMSPLLGKAPSPELVEKIHDKILSYDNILGAHDLMIHDYGTGRKFAGVHVEMSAELSSVECHNVIDKIERDFKKSGLNLLVHLDPVVSDDSAVGRVNREISDIVKMIDERMTVHDLRVIPCSERTKVVFDCVIPTGFDMPEDSLREEIARFVRASHPDYDCVITVDSSFAPIQKNTPDE